MLNSIFKLKLWILCMVTDCAKISCRLRSSFLSGYANLKTDYKC